MEFKLDERFKQKVQAKFDKYEFQVGILEDGPHRVAGIGKRGLRGADVVTAYAGGPIRKLKRPITDSGLTIAQVSEENRKRLGYNYLTRPFQDKTSDIIKFSTEFLKLVFGKSQKRRVENLLQAIVRNPILRGEVGKQSELTTAIKTFDRPMIDTAQLFRAITAKCTKG